MNKIVSIVLIISALIVSVLLGYLMYSSKESVDDSQALQNIESIHELLQIDSAWSLATLQTLTVPDSDFDKVAAFLPRFRDLRNQLSNSDLASSKVPTPLKNKLLAFLSLLEGKEQAIEQFKSNLAVTRNSIKYLPLAAKTLSEKANNIDDMTLAQRIQDVDRQTNNYLKAPDNESKRQVLTKLYELEQNLMEFPAEIVNPLGNFISHARVLIERKVPMDEIVVRVTNDKASKTGTELLSLYKSYEQGNASSRLEQKNQRVQYNLIGIVILILITLIASFYSFFMAKSFNLRLEEDVQKRTSELERVANAATDSVVGGHHDKSMGTMNDMVATMAHEINTPLGYMGSNLEVLQSSTDKLNMMMDEFESLDSVLEEQDVEQMRKRVSAFINAVNVTREEAMLDEFPEVVNDLNAGVLQIQHVIHELRDFSRKDRLEQEWFDLNQSVNDALKMSQHRFEGDINVKKNLGDIPEIYGSPADMNQVMINLINNAALAISEIDRKPGLIKITTSVMKGNIVMDIQDNGKGMEKDVVDKIFDPFFTTRDVGKGTGLGLAIVQKIVKQNHGKVFVKSQPGKGSLFRIAIPMSKKEN